jgi:hypothetical protein
LSFQTAKEQQKKFHLLMILELMPVKLLVSQDQPINLNLKNITLTNMVMDPDSINYIMKFHHMIIGLIKILYFKKKDIIWLKIQLNNKKIGLNYQIAKE